MQLREGLSFVDRSSEDTHPALNTGQEMNYNYHQYRAGRAGNITTAAWKLAQLFIQVLDTTYVDTSKLFIPVLDICSYSVGYLQHFVGFVLSQPDRRAVILAHFKFRPAPPAWSLLRARSDFVNFPL